MLKSGIPSLRIPYNMYKFYSSKNNLTSLKMGKKEQPFRRVSAAKTRTSLCVYTGSLIKILAIHLKKSTLAPWLSN